MKEGGQTVTGGLPDEPDSSDLDAVCRVPGPASFFEALFAALAKIGVHKSTTVVESNSRDDDWEITKGYCGTKDVELRFEELRCLETSDVAMRCAWETRGLPGVEARWDFFLDKCGQIGFAAFSNNKLQVRFQDEKAKAAFTEVWKQVFNKTPVFSPAESK